MPEGRLPLAGDAREVAGAMSVSEYTMRLKQLLERRVPDAWIRGEISNLRRQSSGHCYFTLKDAEAQLPCACFRGDAQRLTVELADGKQVVAFGALSVYPPHGRYQLIVREAVADGTGRLQAEFERLKHKLAEEGLFQADRKRALPLLPATIGYITSPTGAAVRDFISVLRRRKWRGRLVILPARVQGAGAGPEMQRRLEEASASGLFDLLVIGRGGGSLEDLWAFNEEPLVRAIADCRLPVLSGVGHEIDFTLTDFVADHRAETPTAAAELIASQFLECRERYASVVRGLRRAGDHLLERARAQVLQVRPRLLGLRPDRVLERHFQRADDLAERLERARMQAFQTKRNQMKSLGLRLRGKSPQARLQLARSRLEGLRKRFEASALETTLRRGFVLVRNRSGELVKRSADLTEGEHLELQFADGEVAVEVQSNRTSKIRD